MSETIDDIVNLRAVAMSGTGFDHDTDWPENSPSERKEIRRAHGRICMDYYKVANVILVFALDETTKESKNKTYRNLLKLIQKSGDEYQVKEDSTYCPTAYDSYCDLTDIDLFHAIVPADGRLKIISRGLFSIFQAPKFDTNLIEALNRAYQHSVDLIPKGLSPWPHRWPSLPKKEIDLEAVKQNDIDEKFAEIDGKNIAGIMRYAENIEMAELDTFEKVHGTKHILFYPDGAFIGIVVLRPNGQPWRNFLGLRASDIKVIPKEEGENS